MNFFADESLGAIPREVFRVSEINFHAGSMGSSVESSSILLIASSHWNIPGALLRKVPRNPAGKFSRKLLHPLLCQLHHELPRDVGRGAPRKLVQKKKIHRIRRRSFPRDFSRIILCNDRPCVPCDVLHNVPRNFPRDVRRAAP